MLASQPPAYLSGAAMPEGHGLSKTLSAPPAPGAQNRKANAESYNNEDGEESGEDGSDDDGSGSGDGKNKNKRRSKNDVDGRDFKCKYCDKTYLSYPALYTHMKQKHAKGPDGEMRTPPTSGRGRGRPRKNVRFLLEIIFNELLALPTYRPKEWWIFPCGWEKRRPYRSSNSFWQGCGWIIPNIIEVKWQTVQDGPRLPNVSVSSAIFCSPISQRLCP